MEQNEATPWALAQGVASFYHRPGRPGHPRVCQPPPDAGTGRSGKPVEALQGDGAGPVGFSTCSTMLTLPLTMKAVMGNSRVSKKIAGFTLPIGATVNMDGTTLYECIATIFIAQVYGFELTFGAQLIIVITTLLASIGAASVPMSGMVMMSIILKAVGLPLEGVAVILAADRILDMFRTTVNILSDSCGAVIVARLEGESLKGIGEPLPESTQV